MPNIPYVENPRRRRRRARHLSAAQLAAGFGGKRYRKSRSRRRNPGIGILAANPRRRRHHRLANPRRHYRRGSNPSMFGGVTGYLDFKGAAYIAGGILLAKTGPKLLLKVWPGAPQTGLGLYGVQLGCAVAGAVAVKMILKSSDGAHKVAVGGIGYVLYQLANDYLLPSVGLSGLSDSGRYVTTNEIQQMSGYQAAPVAMSGYQSNAMPELSL